MEIRAAKLEPKIKNPRGEPTPVDYIPAKYNFQSTLTADVTANGNQFNFELKSIQPMYPRLDWVRLNQFRTRLPTPNGRRTTTPHIFSSTQAVRLLTLALRLPLPFPAR